MLRYTAALLATVSCVAEDLARAEDGDLAFKATISAKSAGDTLDVASWEIEFFGSTSNGPTNETLQLSNVRDVIAGTDVDIWVWPRSSARPSSTRWPAATACS